MISLARMTAIAVTVNPLLLNPLAPPIGTAIAVLALAMFVFWRQSETDDRRSDAPFANPLDVAFVLRFGALLAAIVVAVKLLSNAFGQAGVLALAGVSGFVDVDPITLSTATLVGGSMTAGAAGQAILLAGAANMATKMAVTVLVGGARFGWKLTLAGVLAVTTGALVFAAMGFT
jgi:uncharacterized membrane protein (DUF4010 family)